MEQNWSNLRFGEIKVASDGKKHIFEVQVYLNGIDANSVRVELYADGVNGGEPVRQEMKVVGQLAGANGTTYSAQVPTTRPATDYTARVIPRCDGVAVPLEASQILWQR
jgi:starch phosphorylase